VSFAGTRPRGVDVVAMSVLEWVFYWRRRRLRGATVLAALPVVLAMIVGLLKIADFEWLDPVQTRSVDILPWFFVLWYLRALVVVIPLLFGTSLISKEVEGNTLAFLLVRPLSRGSLLVGKFLGAWLSASALLCGSFLLSAVILLVADGFADAPQALAALPAYLVALAIGAFAYTALFTLIGLVSRRPALVGLFLAFGWESAIPYLPGLIRNFTVRYHMTALLPDTGLPTAVLGTLTIPPLGAALAWLVLGALSWVVLSVMVFSHRDFT